MFYSGSFNFTNEIEYLLFHFLFFSDIPLDKIINRRKQKTLTIDLEFELKLHVSKIITNFRDIY